MKTVIAGLEEGLNSIAEALGGGGSDIVPTPTQSDQGKALRADYYNGVGRTYWSDANLVPNASGGTNGQVLTTNGETYGWANPSGGSDLPEIKSVDSGKVLTAQYYDKSGSGYAIWSHLYGPTITRVRLDKSDFSYEDKSGNYYMDIADYSIPYNNVINVRSCDGFYTYKNISTYNINPNDGNCYTIYFDSTDYANLSIYVEIIYFTLCKFA